MFLFNDEKSRRARWQGRRPTPNAGGWSRERRDGSTGEGASALVSDAGESRERGLRRSVVFAVARNIKIFTLFHAVAWGSRKVFARETAKRCAKSAIATRTTNSPKVWQIRSVVEWVEQGLGSLAFSPLNRACLSAVPQDTRARLRRRRPSAPPAPARWRCPSRTWPSPVSRLAPASPRARAAPRPRPRGAEARVSSRWRPRRRSCGEAASPRTSTR